MSLLTVLAEGVISLIEKELVNAEPVFANIVIKEIEFLIAKLEDLVMQQKNNITKGS